MRRLLTLLLLLVPASVFAQVAPAVVTTLQTTDTSSTSIKVGCALNSSTCIGGISAGPMQGSSLSVSGGYIEIQSNVPGTTTYRLYNNAGTLTWNGTPLAAGGSLSGTTGKIPVFTASNSIGDSIMTQSGTTITVANTLTATTLGGTLSTASQPNVTTMAGLTSATTLATVGTIGTGVWQGTKIGLAYGGTNADLSGTGGTSQFLRQNTLGGGITVVRPTVADLSDGSSVVLTSGSYSDPAWITSLAVSKLTGTTLPSSVVTSSLTTVGTVTTGTWSGLFGAVTGANLTNLTAANVTGSHTLPDGVLSTNVALQNAAVAFTSTMSVSGLVTVSNDIAWGNDSGFGLVSFTGGKRFLSYTAAGGLSLGSGVTTTTLASTNTVVSGALGINTTSPGFKLAVGQSETSTIGTTVGAVIGNTGAAGIAGDVIQLGFHYNPQGSIPAAIIAAQLISTSGFTKSALVFATRDVTTDTAPTIRWGINTAGDFTYGASSHISDSAGTPVYTSGGGGSLSQAITGTDSAFTFATNNSVSSNSVVFTFGHTWSNAPICVATGVSGSVGNNVTLVTATTTLTVNYPTGVNASFYVLCRGF